MANKVNDKPKTKDPMQNTDEAISNSVNELEELKARLARALADYDNLVKRLSRERDEITVRANKNMLEDLLPVLDNIDRAQSHLKDQGLGMGLTQFAQVLEKYGVQEIKVEEGLEFDAMRHEAIDSRDGGVKGQVAEVLVKGFTWRDGSVVRPAKVAVYSGNQPS